MKLELPKIPLKLPKFSGNKKDKEEEKLKYVLIEIVSPTKIKIETIDPENLPPSLSLSDAVEIETGGKKYIGFLTIRHNLEPLVDIPLIKKLLKENEIIPLDTKKIFSYKILEFKTDLYKAFELVMAGKWARFVYEKQYEAKKLKLENVLIYILIGIVAVIILFVLWKWITSRFASPETVEVTKAVVNTTKAIINQTIVS